MPRRSLPKMPCSTAVRTSPARLATRPSAPICRAPAIKPLAHLASLPHITINGDTAVVVSYLQILTPKKTGDAVEVPNHGASRGYHIHRVVTNRWDLLRTPSGWK